MQIHVYVFLETIYNDKGLTDMFRVEQTPEMKHHQNYVNNAKLHKNS